MLEVLQMVRTLFGCEMYSGSINTLSGAYAAWIDSGSSASSVIRDLVPSLKAPRCYLTRLVLNAVTGLTTLADTVLTYEVHI